MQTQHHVDARDMLRMHRHKPSGFALPLHGALIEQAHLLTIGRFERFFCPQHHQGLHHVHAPLAHGIVNHQLEWRQRAGHVGRSRLGCPVRVGHDVKRRGGGLRGHGRHIVGTGARLWRGHIRQHV